MFPGVPKSGGSQKYIRGDPCDLGSEAENKGRPPRNGCPPETKSWHALAPGYPLEPHPILCNTNGHFRTKSLRHAENLNTQWFKRSVFRALGVQRFIREHVVGL